MFLLPAPVLALTWAVASLAQGTVDDMSFGHKQGISPNSFAIPGWSMLGEGHVPQLLSDKVILTPPYGGNKRGALWTEKQNDLQEWMVDFSFRAGATDRGSGSLQLWYTNDGQSAVSTSSIYTVGKFDGLAIVIDTNAGTQKIRGFLNDGSIEYRTHSNVDSLAFGHCDYTYRNLGRPSNIQVKSTNAGLEVLVDDNVCFSSSKITLPKDYNFGMTAASADPPDSFEVFKFVLTPTKSSALTNNQDQRQQQSHISNEQAANNQNSPSSPSNNGPVQNDDINNRLNFLSDSIASIFTEVKRNAQTQESRYNEILSRLSASSSGNNNNAASSIPKDLTSTIDTRFQNLDRLIQDLSRELKASDHSTQFKKISEQLQKTHEGLTEHVPERMREYVIAHTPRIGFILYSFMAFQTCCVGVFVWYKWRKSTMPKKYL